MNTIGNHQTLALVKHRGVGGIMVRPIGTSRNNDPHRRFGGLHRPHLHRRCMGAQHLAPALGIGRQIEGIMLLACRVFLGNVECGEIIVIGLNVRTLGNGEPHLGKDCDNFFNGAGQRMQAGLRMRA